MSGLKDNDPIYECIKNDRLEPNLNSDLSRLKEYFNLNRLSINVALMLQSVNLCSLVLTYQVLQKILNINFHINGEPINRVSVAKYVGMYID